MDVLQFRQAGSIADWQLMLLALICLVMIMLWYGVKRYAGSRVPGANSVKPVSERYRLQGGQVLHQISFQGKTYLVLESRFGMTQLDVKDSDVAP